MLEPQAAYAWWAASYPPRPHNALMALEQQTVLSLLPDVTGMTALDAGCGTGRYLRLLRDRGARAVGVDLSAAMLARAGADSRRVARADIRVLPIASQSIDVIVCGLVLGDVPDLPAALAELSRVVRPGGRVVYSVVHPVGARAGWSRTFAVAGRQQAIATWWHSSDTHRRACAGAGLHVTAWQEPVLAEAPPHPAVLVVSASRGPRERSAGG
jgi:malonyl-CoA O-methyltransferase